MEERFKRVLTSKDEIELGEKHVPKIEISRIESGFKVTVKVGEKEHPSLPEHFIQWIELRDDEIVLAREILSPFAKPEASFFVKEQPVHLKVRIFCNIHGTWER